MRTGPSGGDFLVGWDLDEVLEDFEFVSTGPRTNSHWWGYQADRRAYVGGHSLSPWPRGRSDREDDWRSRQVHDGVHDGM